MTYNYQTQRANLFTEEGTRLFLKVRDHTRELLKNGGAVRLQEAAFGQGDPWDAIACLDRMVELGELREVIQQGQVPGQYRIFVSAK